MGTERERGGGTAVMAKSYTIALTGSGGLVGSELMSMLEGTQINGRDVLVKRLVRRQPETVDEVQWDASAGDPSLLQDVDAIVHLAGENVGSGEGLLAPLGRWSESKKRKILESRVQGTRAVVDAILGMQRPPSVFVCASAVGYYGFNSGERLFDEGDAQGEGFLADVCRQWEEEAQRAASKTRVVNTRFGVVMSRHGGALTKLLPLFSLGGGGVLGSGEQWFPWVSRRDVAGAILHALKTESLQGPVNVVGPSCVTNAEFTKALGRVLSRPTFFPLPTPVAQVLFGEMGEELLLGGQNVTPKKLLESGYEFQDSTIESALSWAVNQDDVVPAGKTLK